MKQHPPRRWQTTWRHLPGHRQRRPMQASTHAAQVTSPLRTKGCRQWSGGFHCPGCMGQHPNTAREQTARTPLGKRRLPGQTATESSTEQGHEECSFSLLPERQCPQGTMQPQLAKQVLCPLGKVQEYRDVSHIHATQDGRMMARIGKPLRHVHHIKMRNKVLRCPPVDFCKGKAGP